ncbi:hypothetical protein [Pectobacterium sp. CFBP8739]|uniref:hypothetical protein n=1 Tax=Pectobacterium sp. CFBP8739 TaxID=2748908 RepID=UPI0015DF4CF9|nr:hypothetical protein [Pectobacterium sp. CFBP8739]MBA0165957.1 hypothetical protein [Pectobacterium sp. CFBP8739]
MAITYEYHYGNGGFILSKPQQKELEKLLIEQAALASSGAKSLAVPLYDKILSYLPVPDINVGEYFKVYTWLQGAREVNNDSSVYSVFIRNYTKIQYELRYGELNELELSILNNKINEASNNIGFELVDNILSHSGLLPGLEGLGVLDGGEAARKVFQGDINTIKDADSDDKLYINLSSINQLTKQRDLGIELKGGFIIRSSSPNPGGEVILQDGDTAVFYPAIPNPMNFSPALGGSRNMIDETLGDQFIVRYTLSGSTFFVSASFANLDPAEAIIENYDAGDLGLKFKSLVVPNYSNAAASHASNMDQLVDQYVQLHSEMITDRFTLPTSSDLWYA